MSDLKYAFFRDDKEAEKGFSKELISYEYLKYQKKTTMDELNVLPFPGVDTLLKALYRLYERTPDHELFGTKVGATY